MKVLDDMQLLTVISKSSKKDDIGNRQCRLLLVRLDDTDTSQVLDNTQTISTLDYYRSNTQIVCYHSKKTA